ncbi:hypothetical protein P3T37_007362 [Kitasatospora sp. MAA4]|uniref:hypothetical protein n=1 Tax=Kitasatospora sp. MAA4 TaxID=3035093 RepID=UPI0024743AF2|nr:hypothetical protein [Kitasatospora sp. MAA4]MDH6137924.1 hypothetical protein [Kitasatospora sp. MAA4]
MFRSLPFVGLAVATVVIGLATITPASAATSRVDLNVLVVTDGNPWDEAIQAQLASEGVPTTVVDLTSANRAIITGAFLADTLPDGTPHGHFEGVVLPSDAPSQLSAAELASLASYEVAYHVRQVDSYVWPSANVGLNTAQWAGSLDGTTATVTASARADAFRYLNGPVAFEGTAGGSGSYGYLPTPMADNPATGSHFEPFLTETVPGTSTQGTLAGVYTSGGREQLVLNFAYNYYQQQFHLLAHGIVDWVTRGVHLGYWRNFFSAHIDDLFNANSQWSQSGKCTPGEGDCAPGVPATTPIRMTPADVTNAVTWEQQNNYQLDFLFNGGPSVDFQNAQGVDPLTTALLANKNSFWWLNHTYDHTFLGCVQDFSVIPWKCQTDASGNILYDSQADISSQIAQNIQFGQANGLPFRPNELVAGEHSGTVMLPQQPSDNPNFLAALTQNNIQWLGVDASRESGQRQIGSALGTPRHPINVFYNVSTQADEVSEYNWLYGSKASGGSGNCEINPATTTCIAPLDLTTGWSSYVLPLQTQITLGYVLSNDPRPFFMHQSNLTNDRLALQTLSSILSTYRTWFAADTPAVDQTLTDSGTVMKNQTAWQQTQTAGSVSAYVQGGVVTVQGPSGTSVPVTVPAGTIVTGAGSFGTAYAGEQSDFTTIGATSTSLTLPSGGFGVVSNSTPALGAELAGYAKGSPHQVRHDGNAVTITDPFGTHVLPKLAGKPQDELHVGEAIHHHTKK